MAGAALDLPSVTIAVRSISVRPPRAFTRASSDEARRWFASVSASSDERSAIRSLRAFPIHSTWPASAAGSSAFEPKSLALSVAVFVAIAVSSAFWSLSRAARIARTCPAFCAASSSSIAFFRSGFDATSLGSRTDSKRTSSSFAPPLGASTVACTLSPSTLAGRFVNRSSKRPSRSGAAATRETIARP